MEIKNIILFVFIAIALITLIQYRFVYSKHVMIVWPYAEDKAVVYVMPTGIAALVDRSGTFYIYLEDSDDTYVSAVRMEQHDKTMRKILNHKYIIPWSFKTPEIRSYDSKFKHNIVDILNSLLEPV